MKSTWVVGDIHGCATELALLIEKLPLQDGDRFISVGDLYHRGPDPVGVARQLGALPGFEMVLGNHERILAERIQRLPPEAELNGFEAEDLGGDGSTRMTPFPPEESGIVLSLLRNRPYFLRGEHEGQPWLVVHAGLIPGKPVEENTPFELTRTRQLPHVAGQPFWSELWNGPDLVLYGHTPTPTPRPRFVGERMVALGLDTGCVYGGSLTAFRIEDGTMVDVAAKERYYPI